MSFRVLRDVQAGLSLVELLVALAISGTLMVGVVQIFSGSKQVDRLTMAMARVQENGRFAIDILTKELQHIGYQGCFNPNKPIAATDIVANDFPLYTNDTADFTNNTVRGLDDFSASVSSVDLNNGVEFSATPLPSTDALFVAHATVLSKNAGDNTTLQTDMDGFDDQLVVGTNPSGYAQGDMLLITDCETASIFRVSGLTTTVPIKFFHSQGSLTRQNSSASFSVAFTAGSNLHRLVYNTYYIQNNAEGIPSLYRNNYYTGSSALIEGVENLQVLYGHYESQGSASLSDDEIHWLEADAVDSDEWMDIVGVRLAILVRDKENVLPTNGPASFDMLGAEVAPAVADKRLRRVFATTVKIRNRRGEINF